MDILYIGGTGEISYECVLASARAGHRVWIFNRGNSAEPLPPGVEQILGKLNDSAYRALGDRRFDAVCQFLCYDPAQAEKDLAIFSGRTAQYIFVSTASAYQKPPKAWRITEDIPLANPFWPYSQAKADAERFLLQNAGNDLPLTIVRPSHTYRRRFVSTFMAGDDHAWRMLNNRPVIVHGDGTGLWTYTHASDFAVPFVRLLGNARAIGEAFHITRPDAYTWNDIFGAVARALGVRPAFVYVPTQNLVRINPEWAGPLLGDKANSVEFDLTKLKSAVGEFECRVGLDEGMARVAPYVRERLRSFEPDAGFHARLDRIAEAQGRVEA